MSQIVWGIEIWPRHSFLTKAFIPLKSDLDLSAYVLSLDSLNGYLRYYRGCKKLFPFIGELNVYTPDSISFIKSKDVNGFELERDPILVSRFNIDLSNKRYFSREKAASYLLMALVNDFHKLKADPNSRLKKWNYHFDHVNTTLMKHQISARRAALDEATLVFSIVTAIVNLGNPASVKQAELLRSKIRLFLELLPQAESTPNFIDIVSPIVTDENGDVCAYFVEYLATIGVALPTTSHFHFGVMSEQIRWVAFRYLKQSFAEAEIKTAIKRISELKSLVAAQELIADLSLVSQLISKRSKDNS